MTYRIRIPKAYEISMELKTALIGKKLDEEDIAAVYNALSERKKRQKTSIIAIIIFAVVFLAVMGIPMLVNGANPVIGVIYILFVLILLGVSLFVGIYLFTGKVAKQWNNLLRENYPQLADKYIL